MIAMDRIAAALERIADALEADRRMHQLIEQAIANGGTADPKPVEWFRDNDGHFWVRDADGAAWPSTYDDIKRLGLA